MPKSTKNHNRDRIATDALRKIFPKSWLFKNPRDVDSGREYSEDWIIEIVSENDQPTGIEFGIQNKTDAKVNKSHVGFVLLTDDIKRLMNLRRSILLHAHDMKYEKSYWRWLPEWYASTERQPDWDKTKTITIKIPLTNILDEDAIKAISTYASWDHEKRTAERMAELANLRYGKDFDVVVRSHDNSLYTIINAKHDASVPTVRALDEAAREAMMQAIETGLPVPLVGKFTVEGVPDTLSHDSTLDLEFALIWPHRPQETVPVKIEFLGENDDVLLRSPIVQVQVIQPGTMIVRAQGIDKKHHVTYTFTEDKKQKTSEFGVKFECKSRNAVELQEFFTFVDRVRPVKKFKITYLDTDPEQIDYRDGNNFFKLELTPEEQAMRFIVRAFALIETELGVPIPVPDKLNDQLLRECGFVSSVIVEGISPLNIDPLVPEDHGISGFNTVVEARELLSRYEDYGYIDVYMKGQDVDVQIDFAGHSLNFGKARPMFRQCKIAYLDDLKSYLEREDVSEDTEVQIFFEIDRKATVWDFLDWPRGSEKSPN